MIKTNGMKLMECINELEEIESIDTKLTFAIFRSSAYSKIESMVNKLKQRIEEQMKASKISNDTYDAKNKEMIKKYEDELRKIYVEYENSIINVQLEMQEAESNQKIAIANLKKINDMKNEALQKQEYIEQLINNPELHKQYTNKVDAYIEKFNNYNKIIDECLIETELVRQEFLRTLDEVDIIDENNQLTTKNESFFQGLINKIKSLFSNKKSYETQFVNPTEENITKLENENVERIKEVSRKNVKFLATIIVMKKKINQYFNLTAERG